MAEAIKNKFDGLVQEQIDQIFHSGVKFAQLLRTLAFIFLLVVGIYTIYMSLFTNKKFFHENNSLIKAVQEYEYIK